MTKKQREPEITTDTICYKSGGKSRQLFFSNFKLPNKIAKEVLKVERGFKTIEENKLWYDNNIVPMVKKYFPDCWACLPTVNPIEKTFNIFWQKEDEPFTNEALEVISQLMGCGIETYSDIFQDSTKVSA